MKCATKSVALTKRINAKKIAKKNAAMQNHTKAASRVVKNHAAKVLTAQVLLPILLQKPKPMFVTTTVARMAARTNPNS